MFEFAAHEFDAFILAKGFVRAQAPMAQSAGDDDGMVVSTIGQLNENTIGQDSITYVRNATTIKFVASAAHMHLSILVSGKQLFARQMNDFSTVRDTVEEYCG